MELIDEDGKAVVDLSNSLSQTWQHMERFYKEKLARSIGVSNFNVKQLQEIYDNAEIKPQNLQVNIKICFE